VRATRVCFLLERGIPPRRNLVVEATVALLEERGVTVRTIYPEEVLLRLDTLAVEADLYLLKSNTELALSLATALEEIGARVLNTCAATERTTNKVLAAATLLAAGLPTPRSLATGQPLRLAGEVEANGPLILKPHRGHYGLGIVVAHTSSDLLASDACADSDVVFAQHYLPHARTDLKVFAVGDQVFGVRKRFVAGESFAQVGEPSGLSPDLEEIARRVGRALGLELYGLDIVEESDADYVVDVNSFPGYRGVPDAAGRLTDHILRRAVRG
jgi:ribosomal protein S6--L-glutamate ligase